MVFLINKLGFIDNNHKNDLKNKCSELAKMISSLIKYLENHQQ